MPLDEIEITFDLHRIIPPDAQALIADAEDRVQRFLLDRQERRAALPLFVASDFNMVYRTLCRVLDQNLATGDCFCEWGCGFGVVAGLGSMLGLDAHGIEIEHDLIDQAQQLIDDHGLPTVLVQGSFVPYGGDDFIDTIAQQAWLKTGEETGYDELGLDTHDFDLIFAYPWPGEEELVELLFEKFAARGALLLTYHGMNEMRLHRKM